MKHFFFSETESYTISKSLELDEDDVIFIPFHLSYGDLTKGVFEQERVSFLESERFSSDIDSATQRLKEIDEKPSDEVCIWFRMKDSDDLLGFCFLCSYFSYDTDIYVQSYPYEEYFCDHAWGTVKDENFIKACRKGIRHLSKEERLAASEKWKDISIQRGIFRRVIESEVQNVLVNYYDRIIKAVLKQYPNAHSDQIVGNCFAEINEPVADDWLYYRVKKIKASVVAVSITVYLYDFGFLLIDNDGSVHWYNYGDRLSLKYHLMHLEKIYFNIHLEIHRIDFSTSDENVQSLIDAAEEFLIDLSYSHHTHIHDMSELENLLKLIPENVLKRKLYKDENISD